MRRKASNRRIGMANNTPSNLPLMNVNANSANPGLLSLLVHQLEPDTHWAPWIDNYNPEWASKAFADDWDIANQSYQSQLSNQPPHSEPEDVEMLAPYGSSGPPKPQSDMAWICQYCPQHHKRLRYARGIFINYLVTKVPYHTFLHPSQLPVRRRRATAQLSWRLACRYFGGCPYQNMALVRESIVMRVDEDIMLDTVHFRTSLPEKSSYSRIYYSSKRRRRWLKMHG